MTTAVVFDVNETMLDLAKLDPYFVQIFGDAGLRREWFALVLRNALTMTIIGEYSDFATVGGASLDMVAAANGFAISAADRALISFQMTQLPSHHDVPENLSRLQDAGLRLAALTNSPPDVANRQLANAGLTAYFDHILSVHAVGRFKPHPDVYRYAATTIGVPVDKIVMVAAHDWDVAGAMAAGMDGAFVLRRGMVRNPLLSRPTMIGSTMTEVATAILESRTS